MLKVYLMLVLSAAAAVFAESVRETETWVPLKNKSPHEDLESSGDSPQQDFEFDDLNPTDDEDNYDDDDDDDEDEDDYDDMSGSGFSEIQTIEDDLFSNQIPDPEGPFDPQPTEDGKILVKKNEVVFGGSPDKDGDQLNNVLMTHAGDESLFHNKEVLAAVIAGGAVGLVFAILLIVLLVHFVLRIKKKDEGSYDLGKTPIYKKAPTAEIYA
ncbi:syndecan-4 [Megalobrama amblycephala]|uniref:syndecan-4 n=1 Tax=Megalobrama amblycephala TaxID=75352 RepID=UPI002013FCC1|nr:syndecan-4 [Megalobrama amblycephala]XP_048055079.1 syndecan-4 [Megalobrama amblycephala]XP_048055080.1 syndecan-4 [Megalobrama amblycephala]